jgi:hypothetical protein
MMPQAASLCKTRMYHSHKIPQKSTLLNGRKGSLTGWKKPVKPPEIIDLKKVR